jgi:hypothetical protein
MNRRSTFALIFVALICASATGIARQRILGTIADAAPVTIVPEPGRTPLATLVEGTQVQILGPEENGWYRITFQDNYLLGDRVGYVRAEHVRVGSAPIGPAGRGTPPASSSARKNGTASAPPTSRPRGALSESSIAEAIIVGRQRRTAGLRLLDNGQRWTSDSPGGSRIRLQIHTPLAWIQQLAADAAVASRPFTMSDVTDEMTEPVLRIVVCSEVSGAPTGAGALWVRQVLLRANGMTPVRPAAAMPFAEHVLSAAGNSSVFEGMRLTFPLDAVRRLRGARGDAELVIVMIGASGDEKAVSVTREYLQDLPM